MLKSDLKTKLSDVAMMVTRFELMGRWVETEIVSLLTLVSVVIGCSTFLFVLQIITEKAGRVALVNRFIKLAAKCYSLNNLLYVVTPSLHPLGAGSLD